MQLHTTPDPDLEHLADDRGPDFYPFWNEKRTQEYAKLWIPDGSRSRVESHRLGKNHDLWFQTRMISEGNTINNQTNFTTVDDGNMPKEIICCRKFKLKLSRETRDVVTRWSDLWRTCYNRAVWLFNETGMTGRKLRDSVKNNAQWGFHPYVLELPASLREGASDAVTAGASAAFTNLQSGNITHFTMRYLKKKIHRKKWTISGFSQPSYIKHSPKTFTLFKTRCPHMIHSTRVLPDEMEHDFKLHFDGRNYWLIVPYQVTCDPEKKLGKVVALDPGIRTFQTCYFTNEPRCVEVCTGRSVAHLHSLAIHLDRMISARARRAHRRDKQRFRKTISKRIDKVRVKMKNL